MDLKKAPLFLIMLVSPHTGVRNSIIHGTIIVIGKSADRTILAADSRAGFTRNGIDIDRVDDTYCKIAALGGNAIFAVSGVLGSPQKEWSAIAVASNIPTHAAAMTREEGLQFLLNWSTLTIQKLYSTFSADQLLAVASHNNRGITSGVLAGINADGTTWSQVVTIEYSSDFGLQVPTKYDLSAKSDMGFFSLGKGEIMQEFVDSTSLRARKENRRWRSIRKNMGRRAFEEFEANRLVDLTIQHHTPTQDVGGPIDEVVMDVNGSRWIALKPSCDPGNAKPPKNK